MNLTEKDKTANALGFAALLIAGILLGCLAGTTPYLRPTLLLIVLLIAMGTGCLWYVQRKAAQTSDSQMNNTQEPIKTIASRVPDGQANRILGILRQKYGQE